jgi:cysteine desulfurase
VRLAVAAHERAGLLHPARSCADAELCLVPASRDGVILPQEFAARGGRLFACSHGHPELGALQPVAALSAAARAAGARVHVDATLTAGRVRTDFASLGFPTTVAVSFHHFGGPMGVGALLFGEELELPPLIAGGTEEDGRRAGTPNLAGIVGAGVAARVAAAEIDARERDLRAAAETLARVIFAVDGVRSTGPRAGPRVPGHVSAVVDGIDGEALVAALDDRGVLASTGSPCGLDAGLRSASLRAAGYAPEEARSAVVLCVPPVAIPDARALRAAGEAFAASVVALRGIAGHSARRAER